MHSPDASSFPNGAQARDHKPTKHKSQPRVHRFQLLGYCLGYGEAKSCGFGRSTNGVPAWSGTNPRALRKDSHHTSAPINIRVLLNLGYMHAISAIMTFDSSSNPLPPQYRAEVLLLAHVRFHEDPPIDTTHAYTLVSPKTACVLSSLALIGLVIA